MIIDTSCWLGHWPFRTLPLEGPDRLADRLHQLGITQAWTGSFESLLHRDVAQVNRQIVAQCRAAGEIFTPIGTVNPALPDWQEDLRRCREEFGMPGIRLIPNYHGYELSDPAVAQLLDLAGQSGLFVQIAVMMEDERTQHPLVRVPPVNLTPLGELLTSRPQLPVILLHASRVVGVEPLRTLLAAGQVFVEISMLEGVGALGTLTEKLPAERILFGTAAPLFIPEAAIAKLRESELGDYRQQRITHANAQALLTR